MKTHRILIILLTILLFPVLFLSSGCNRNKDKSPILASIGDETITVSDYSERISNLPARYREIIKKRKKKFLEEYINDTLLYQEALRHDLHKDKDVLKVIKEARKKILIARLLKDKVDDTVVINEEDIVQFYNNNKSRYMTPEIMRVSHILLPTQEEAEDILEQINAGSSFDEMARSKSVDPTAQRGGDIGYFPKGQLMSEFENACSLLEIEEISNVVKTKLGYHIIKLTARKEPKERPLDKVREDIKSRLRRVKRQKIFNSLLKRLRAETPVEINEQALSGVYTSDADTAKTGGSK